MSYYSFKIKKGKFELAVISQDKYFVISQFDKVYLDTIEKPKKSGKPEPAKSKPEEKPVQAELTKEEPAQKEPVKEEPAKEEASSGLPTSVPEPQSEEPAEELLEEPEKDAEEEQQEAAAQEPEPSEEDDEPIIAKTAPKKVVKNEDDNDFSDQQGPEIVEEPELTSEEQEEEAIKKETDDSFASIIEEKLKAEPEKEAEDVPEEGAADDQAESESEEDDIAQTLRETFEESSAEPAKNNKVYDILQEKLSDIPEEEKDRLNLNRKASEHEKETSTVLKFNDIEDLIYVKKPQTKLDYLMLTSYYLQEKEKKEKYSLKQINAKIIPHLKEAIDHSVIHESIAHGYFEVVPDYDGDSDLTEYKITEDGVDYLLNEL